jgi:hypothetical protein
MMTMMMTFVISLVCQVTSGDAAGEYGQVPRRGLGPAGGV